MRQISTRERDGIPGQKGSALFLQAIKLWASQF